MTRASTLLLLLAALDGTRGGEVYIEPAYTAAIGDYACVRLDSAADALYTMDEDIYIDADKRDLNEACLRLGNSTATEMASEKGRHEANSVSEQSCSDSYPYAGTSLYLAGRGPVRSCSDACRMADSIGCAGIRSRIKDQWCRKTCGTCNGGGGSGGGGGGGGGDAHGRRLRSALDTLAEADKSKEVSTNWTNFSVETNSSEQVLALQALLDEYGRTCKQPPPDIEALHWTFAGSVFFAFQVMTTVGYGTFAPQTPGGRVFTVCFGVVGIVATGFVLGMLTRAIDALLEKARHRLLSRTAYHQRAHAVRFKALAAALLLAAYLAAAALVAAYREDLPFGVALYFVFVTVSTVGLGDYTLRGATIGDVLVQLVVFLPGLALFAEFINLGNEASAHADETAVHVSGHLASKLRGSTQQLPAEARGPPPPSADDQGPGPSGGSPSGAGAAKVSARVSVE